MILFYSVIPFLPTNPHMRKLLRPIVCFTGLLLLLSVPLAAQDDSSVSELGGVDKAFSHARELAFEGEREKAKNLLRNIIQESPNYIDVRLFLARIHYWDGAYDKAREELNTIAKLNEGHRESLKLRIDVEYSSGNMIKALQLSRRAVKENPADTDLLLQKAKILAANQNESEALTVLAQVDQIEPGNSDAAAMRQRIRTSRQNYTLTLGYYHDRFDRIFDPWQTSYVQLGRSTPVGTVIGRVNHANRFATGGWQGELDFYPSIRPGTYGYLNAGYSNATIFPEYRLGAEIHQSLPKSFEFSAGFRHMRFRASNVTIFTGSLTRYIGNWMLTARPYFTPSDVSFSRSIQLITRRYFSNADTYLGIRGGLGFSPDERRFVGEDDDIQFLRSYTLAAEYNHRIRNHLIGFGGISHSGQERPFDDDLLKSLTFHAGMTLRF